MRFIYDLSVLPVLLTLMGIDAFTRFSIVSTDAIFKVMLFRIFLKQSNFSAVVNRHMEEYNKKLTLILRIMFINDYWFKYLPLELCDVIVDLL